MNVQIHLLSQSQPVRRTHVRNTYVKEGFYCALTSNGQVEKYPAGNIFRVVEDES